MTLRDLAVAHLQTVSAKLEELRQQQVTLDTEITRLTSILEEGSKLVQETSTVDVPTN